MPQLLTACEKYKAGYMPHFTFIVVQKRINTRIFAVSHLIYSEIQIFIKFFFLDRWQRQLGESVTGMCAGSHGDAA